MSASGGQGESRYSALDSPFIREAQLSVFNCSSPAVVFSWTGGGETDPQALTRASYTAARMAYEAECLIYEAVKDQPAPLLSRKSVGLRGTDLQGESLHAVIFPFHAPQGGRRDSSAASDARPARRLSMFQGKGLRSPSFSMDPNDPHLKRALSQGAGLLAGGAGSFGLAANPELPTIGENESEDPWEIMLNNWAFTTQDTDSPNLSAFKFSDFLRRFDGFVELGITIVTDYSCLRKARAGDSAELRAAIAGHQKRDLSDVAWDFSPQLLARLEALLEDYFREVAADLARWLLALLSVRDGSNQRVRDLLGQRLNQAAHSAADLSFSLLATQASPWLRDPVGLESQDHRHPAVKLTSRPPRPGYLFTAQSDLVSSFACRRAAALESLLRDPILQRPTSDAIGKTTTLYRFSRQNYNTVERGDYTGLLCTSLGPSGQDAFPSELSEEYDESEGDEPTGGGAACNASQPDVIMEGPGEPDGAQPGEEFFESSMTFDGPTDMADCAWEPARGGPRRGSSSLGGEAAGEALAPAVTSGRAASNRPRSVSGAACRPRQRNSSQGQDPSSAQARPEGPPGASLLASDESRAVCAVPLFDIRLGRRFLPRNGQADESDENSGSDTSDQIDGSVSYMAPDLGEVVARQSLSGKVSGYEGNDRVVKAVEARETGEAGEIGNAEKGERVEGAEKVENAAGAGSDAASLPTYRLRVPETIWDFLRPDMSRLKYTARRVVCGETYLTFPRLPAADAPGADGRRIAVEHYTKQHADSLFRLFSLSDEDGLKFLTAAIFGFLSCSFRALIFGPPSFTEILARTLREFLPPEDQHKVAFSLPPSGACQDVTNRDMETALGLANTRDKPAWGRTRSASAAGAAPASPTASEKQFGGQPLPSNVLVPTKACETCSSVFHRPALLPQVCIQCISASAQVYSLVDYAVAFPGPICVIDLVGGDGAPAVRAMGSVGAWAGLRAEVVRIFRQRGPRDFGEHLQATVRAYEPQCIENRVLDKALLPLVEACRGCPASRRRAYIQSFVREQLQRGREVLRRYALGGAGEPLPSSQPDTTRFTVTGMHVPSHGLLVHAPGFLLPVLGSRGLCCWRPHLGGLREQRVLLYPEAEADAPNATGEVLDLAMKYEPSVGGAAKSDRHVSRRRADREALECAIARRARNAPPDSRASLGPRDCEAVQKLVQRYTQELPGGEGMEWMAAMVWRAIGAV